MTRFRPCQTKRCLCARYKRNPVADQHCGTRVRGPSQHRRGIQSLRKQCGGEPDRGQQFQARRHSTSAKRASNRTIALCAAILRLSAKVRCRALRDSRPPQRDPCVWRGAPPVGCLWNCVAKNPVWKDSDGLRNTGKVPTRRSSSRISGIKCTFTTCGFQPIRT